jgi:hypothetical protein
MYNTNASGLCTGCKRQASINKDQFGASPRDLLMRVALLLLVLGYCSIHYCNAINKLFVARYPLVGGPSFLKLHIAIVHEHSGALTQFDFLPANPTAAATAFRLLKLQTSPGELRERRLRFKPKDLQYICETNASVQELRAFTAAYDDQLHLLNNSCSSFADRLIDRFSADTS